MKKLNFKNFLVERDKDAKAMTLLTEGLTDIKQMVFPHVGMNDAIKFMRIMPGWKNSTLNAEIELNFASDNEIKNFTAKCEEETKKFNIPRVMNGFQQNVKSSGGSVTTYELAKPENLPENLYEQFCSQMFATIMKFFKTKNLGALMRFIKRDGNKILITSEDAAQRGNTWKKIDDICGNKTISDGIAATTAGMAEMKTTKDAARKEQLKPEMKKRGDEISAALNAIPAESGPNKEDQAKIDANTKTEEMRKTMLYKGNIEECFYVYLLDLKAVKNDQTANANMLIGALYTGEQLHKIINLRKVIETGLTYYSLTGPYKPISEDFAKIVKFTGDVSEMSRKLLQMLNTLVAPRPANWAEGIKKQIAAVRAKAEQEQNNDAKAKLQQELTRLQDMEKSPQPTVQQILNFIKDKHVGICLVNYLKKREKDLETVKAEQERAEQNGEKFDIEAAMAKVRLDITRYGSLPEMFDAVIADTKNLFGDVKEEDIAKEEEKRKKIEAMKQAKPQFKNPTAARRWKLFEAVKALGGEVLADENWTASVTLTAKQLGVFSRNKPKTKEDHKTILPGANLEDREGITPANKEIRDGGGPWIFDGISKKFDTQETETCWCVGGSYCNHNKSLTGQTAIPWAHTRAGNPVTSGYAIYDNGNKTRCLVQFMENSSGRLFMVGESYVLDEADTTAGSIAGNSSGGIQTLKACCERLPDFGKFMKNSGLWDRIIKKSGVKVKSDADLMIEAIHSGIITADGEMHLSSRNQLDTYKCLIERVSKINILTDYAVRFFADMFGETEIGMPPINCERVKTADSMFAGIHSRNITLESTENITSMGSMFMNTVTENIQGLNTRSAVNMGRAFYNCRQKVFKMTSIPTLDMRNCTNINECFRQSYISIVNMQNTDKITSAKDAFVDMPLLQRTPNVKFKNIMGAQQLRSTFSGDYSVIFDGCDKLLGEKKFDEELLDIEKFYQHPDRKNDYTDDRGYLILRSQDDVNRYAKDFYKYPGVVLDKGVDTSMLFNELSYIKIRVLDVNGISSLERLIYECSSFSIGAIIGTQNVTRATQMFAYSKCSRCPKLNFPALRGDIDVFKDMYPFGNVNSDGFFKVGQYVKPFRIPEGNNYVESVAQMLFGSKAQEWRQKTTIENVVENLYTSQLAERDRILKEKYKAGEDGFVEIADLADFSENLPDILETKPAGLRFSKPLVEQLNNMKELPEGIWSKTSGKHLDMPKLDLNGLVNANNLFKNAQFARINGITGLNAIVQANSMFECAQIVNMEEILHGQTFAALKSANSMFRGFKSVINIQSIKFPVLENADAMFMSCGIANPELVVDFPSVVNAKSMFYGCRFRKIQSVNIPNAQDASHMFAECPNLEFAGTVALPRCRIVQSIFYNCYGLKAIGELTVGDASSVDSMFAECGSLKNIHICKMGPNTADRGDSVFYNCPLSEIYGKHGEIFFARAKLLNK